MLILSTLRNIRKYVNTVVFLHLLMLFCLKNLSAMQIEINDIIPASGAVIQVNAVPGLAGGVLGTKAEGQVIQSDIVLTDNY